jgi:engulfment/cell motility protein 1
MFRFYRLSPNTKCLHYAEYVKIKDTRPPLEELIEKIDLSTNMDIMEGSSLMVQHNKRNINSNLCFSLVGNRDSENLSHIDFICDSVVKYSEWIDGFNMFLDKNISSKSTAKYIQQLTDINLKLCLLELGSERIDIPVIPPEIPSLPTDYQFFYEEGWFEAIDISDFEKNLGDHEQSQENLFNLSNATVEPEINEIELNVEKNSMNNRNKFSPLTVNTKHSIYDKDDQRGSYITPLTTTANIFQSVFDSNRYQPPLDCQDIIDKPLPPMPPPLLNRSSSLRNSEQSEEMKEMNDSNSIKNNSGPMNG